jgi:hypothetical protein
MLHNLIFPGEHYKGFHSEYDSAIEAYLAGASPGEQTSWGKNLVLSWPKEDAGNKDDCNQSDATCYEKKLQALQKKEVLFADNTSPQTHDRRSHRTGQQAR